MKIDGIVAAVCGGASGLGAAAAEHLSALGARVYIIDVDKAKGAELADHCGGEFICADVTTEKSLGIAIAKIADGPGQLRLLVNAVGIGGLIQTLGKRGVHDLGSFKRIVDVNLVGSFNALRLCAEQIGSAEADVGGERGVIINTASIAAMDGPVAQAAYSASKAGIVGMTLPIARDLGKYGIRVMTIAPGIFATPLSAQLPQEVLDQQTAHCAFPQCAGDPEAYARLVEAICVNPMLNGEVVRLDAGLRLGT